MMASGHMLVMNNKNVHDIKILNMHADKFVRATMSKLLGFLCSSAKIICVAKIWPKIRREK